MLSRCLYGSSRNGLNSILSAFSCIQVRYLFSVCKTLITLAKKIFLESLFIALNSVLWGITNFLDLKVSLCFIISINCSYLNGRNLRSSQCFAEVLVMIKSYLSLFSTASFLQSFIQTLPEKCFLTFRVFPLCSAFASVQTETHIRC